MNEQQTSRRTGTWGFVLALGALLIPPVAIVALILGAITAARGKVGVGIAVMLAAVALGWAGVSLRVQQAADRAPLTECIEGVPVEAGGCWN